MLNWFPQNVSTFGHEVDSIISFIYYVVGALFILTEIVVFWIIFQARKKANPNAGYHSGTKINQFVWIIIPTALLVITDFSIEAKGHHAWKTIKETLPQKALEIEVSGQQFAWDFVIPGQDEKLGTEDDLKMQTELVVPANTDILFHLSSVDVLHSFWIPSLRLKQDAVPGRSIKGWFNVTTPGSYPIACAEICGVGHTKMGAVLTVKSKDEYAKWVSEQEVYEEW